MDERCKSAHAKLLAGKCPWCGRFFLAGEVEDTQRKGDTFSAENRQEGKSLQQLVHEQGVLSFNAALNVLKLIAQKLIDYYKTKGPPCGVTPYQIVILGDDALISDDTRLLLKVYASDSAMGCREARALADYLAPEQALNSHRADFRSDIYSLGCLLYFLLTGHPPFQEDSISETLLKHQIETPPSILKNRPDAPAKLVELCEKMLAKSPQLRYQSAEELLSAIKAL